MQRFKLCLRNQQFSCRQRCSVQTVSFKETSEALVSHTFNMRQHGDPEAKLLIANNHEGSGERSIFFNRVVLRQNKLVRRYSKHHVAGDDKMQ